MSPARRTFLAMFIVLVASVAIWLGTSPLRTPRIPLNHRRAIERVRDLTLAERNYAARHPEAGYACSLGDLGEQGLVDRVLASGTQAGYHFDIHCPETSNQGATAYTITALPVDLGHTGTYALCTDQSGYIWYSENGSVSDCVAMHKPIEQKYR
jgi:hypothetical protein